MAASKAYKEMAAQVAQEIANYLYSKEVDDVHGTMPITELVREMRAAQYELGNPWQRIVELYQGWLRAAGGGRNYSPWRGTPHMEAGGSIAVERLWRLLQNVEYNPHGDHWVRAWPENGRRLVAF